MAEDIKRWEYRVQTVGGTFWTKDELIQTTLDEWRTDGWEAVSVYTPSGRGRLTIVAKRPLTERVRRMRTMPSM